MTEPVITCPHCHTDFLLNESLAAPLITAAKEEYEHKTEQLTLTISEREKNISLQEKELQQSKQNIHQEIEEKVALSLEKEKDQLIEDAKQKLQKQNANELNRKTSEIKELKQKAEQGSQQSQGEVQELLLEQTLQTQFYMDQIAPVPKGEFGGDVLQHVLNPQGMDCGLMIWEAKRTKHWNNEWFIKLKDDQRTAKADVAIIVSHALPNNIETFDCIDGIWIIHPKVILPVTALLRESLIQVNFARQSAKGQETKAEMIYDYLTGTRFRQRVEAIVEAFNSMQDDLNKEKKVITKQWAKREEQINRVMQSTIGMYGDLQGIVGQSLQEIEGLELDSLLLE